MPGVVRRDARHARSCAVNAPERSSLSGQPHRSRRLEARLRARYGFVYKTLSFSNDYDGKVTATVVRNEPLVANARGAVLFIHGFLDYVFHRHVAERLIAARYNFFGLDLRKYGRSMDGAVHPNFCHSMQEY